MNLRISPEELTPKPGARSRLYAAGKTFEAEKVAKRKEEEERAAKRACRVIPIRCESDDYRAAFEALAVTVRLAVAVVCSPSSDMPAPKPVPFTHTRAILEETATKYGLTVDDLRGPRRHHNVSWARQEAFYRLHAERKNLTLPMIGRLLNKDHTTALYGIRRYAQIMGLPDPSRKQVKA